MPPLLYTLSPVSCPAWPPHTQTYHTMHLIKYTQGDGSAVCNPINASCLVPSTICMLMCANASQEKQGDSGWMRYSHHNSPKGPPLATASVSGCTQFPTWKAVVTMSVSIYWTHVTRHRVCANKGHSCPTPQIASIPYRLCQHLKWSRTGTHHTWKLW